MVLKNNVPIKKTMAFHEVEALVNRLKGPKKTNLSSSKSTQLT